MSFRIFIVDDDPAMTEMTKDFLESRYADCDIFTFPTGEGALAELYRKPEVIILDYHLDSIESKAMNGIEVLKRIKELLPSVPVIFISSDENPEVATHTIKYGAYDYITKNESAFQRMEIMVNNSTGHFSVQRQLKTQRIFNIVLLIILVSMVVGFFISQLI
jgi:two-component system OmpR family response regulator